MSMDWKQLLSAHRLGGKEGGANDPARSPFQIDSDRIVFCSAFRRLQDKTQVFPLADNDFVRTRLTHSLEVASVGRSLGARVGAAIVERHGLAPQFHASDFGAIVSAASLAHDLGNPPFGHSGEDAIRHWFKTSEIARTLREEELSAEQLADFEDFEGNAQGFRVVTRLQMPDNPGLRLTCATLGAFTKYPRGSKLAAPAPGVSQKKFGFFQAEASAFAEVAERTGLLSRSGAWCRHPLAYLVEAADDISYRLVDFEDGFRLKHLSYDEVSTAFAEVIREDGALAYASSKFEPNEGIAFLRAKAIGVAIEQAAAVFLENEATILAGEFDEELLTLVPSQAALQRIKVKSRETIYATDRGVEIEAAGYEVLGALLELFFGAADDIARHGTEASRRSQKLLQLVPRQFLGTERKPESDPYIRLLRMTDFVSGMTDSYAVTLYRKVRGIALPGE